MDRRTFMQMLGIGGMGSLSAASIPLFGSSEAKPPEPKSGPGALSGHWVVKAKPLTQKMNEPPLGDFCVVKRLTPMRSPKRELGRRVGACVSYVPYDGTTKDAHRAYYLGSQELRSKFTKQSLKFLAETTEPSDYPTLVTVVDSEIQAYPSHEAYVMVLGLEYVQHAVRGVNFGLVPNGFPSLREDPKSLEDFISTFECYSEFGEYPISVPRDIDFGVMLKLDSQVVTLGEKPSKDRVSKILGNLLG